MLVILVNWYDLIDTDTNNVGAYCLHIDASLSNAVVVYHVSNVASKHWRLEEIWTYGNRQRSTHTAGGFFA